MKEDEGYLISLKDCKAILKKGKLKILSVAGVLALAGSLYALTRPIYYEANATFKEKTNTPTGISSNSLAMALFSGLSAVNKSEAANTMKSKRLIDRLIQQYGLQSDFRKETKAFPIFERIFNNAFVAWNSLTNNQNLPLEDKYPVVRIDKIKYAGETPAAFKIKFLSEDKFQVFDKDNKTLGTGYLNEAFAGNDFLFSISRITNVPLSGTSYKLNLLPTALVAKKLAKDFDILSDKDDPTLLKLKYRNQDRHQASELLNSLMEIYQTYLKEERLRISREQIAYLHSRQREMGENLQAVLDQYADRLSVDVAKYGYAQSEKMFEFLTDQLHEYWEKMLAIELEMQRQTMPQFNEKSPLSIQFQANNVTEFFNSFVEKMRLLKQEGEALELSLRGSSLEDAEEWQKSFKQQVAQLGDLAQSIKDVQILLEHLQSDQFPLPDVKIIEHPSYKITVWKDRLSEAINTSNGDFEEAVLIKIQFASYLTNLLHFLEVSEKTIQERLARQQAPRSEFQGIDIDSAKELYITYNKKLCDLESQITQLQFGIDQLREPGFELTSLGTVINDPVTQDMMMNASKQILSYHDDANYSAKEKERLNNAIQIQRQFIDLHLNQSVQLFKLEANLYKDIIRSLQKASLELIQQQITILDKDLYENLALYTQQLSLEHNLLKEKELDIRNEMGRLPKKWADEKLIEQEMKINAAMVEEIAKLVESKNITSNLELVQSAPLDIAIAPTHPKPPQVFLFAAIGGILGLFLGAGQQLISTLRRGLPATLESLTLSGAYVAGILTLNEKDNRQVIRALISHFMLTHNLEFQYRNGVTVACVQGVGKDISKEIALLLNKQGGKVVVLDLAFNQGASREAGLLQFMDGEIAEPPIQHENGYDAIAAGGTTSYANELIGSKAFAALVDKLASEYDWVIAVSDATPNSPEAHTIIQLFDQTVLNIHHETLDELHDSMQLAKKAHVSFIIS